MRVVCQRRALRPPDAAARPRAPRAHVPHRLGRRGARAPVRGARAGVRRGPARHVRGGAVGRAAADASCSRATRSGSSRSSTRGSGGRLAFASELKALLALPELPARDRSGGGRGATWRSTPCPRRPTLFRAAHKLEPGHRLIAEGGRVAIERYARPRPLPASELRREPLEALAGEARARLAEFHPRPPRCRRACRRAAVGRRGLQPITALAPRRPLKTFSVGFDVAAFDELARRALGRRALRHRPSRAAAGAVGRRSRSRAWRRPTTSRQWTPPPCPTGCWPALLRVMSRPY